MPPVRLVYETHATTTDNEAGFATGWLPGTLSAAGREQARELGARRRDDGITAVFTSDLARAVQTAQIAFAGSPLPMHRDRRLRECDYGDLNGCPITTLEPLRARHVDRPFPGGGQSYRDVLAATEEFLGEVSGGRYGDRVLVIAHSANRWALQCLLCGRPLESLVDEPFDWQPGWEFTLPDGGG